MEERKSLEDMLKRVNEELEHIEREEKQLATAKEGLQSLLKILPILYKLENE